MNRYQEPPARFRAETARVTSATNTLQLAGHTAWQNLRIAAPDGMFSIPPTGKELLLLPLADGEMVVCGSLAQAPADLSPGELLLQNASGASIRLKTDGSISLNGLIIDRNGQIRP